MSEPLTDLERAVFDYVVEYQRRHTYPPSVREIGSTLGIPSTRTVAEHLAAIAEKGWIERSPSRARGIRILGGPGSDSRPVAAEFEPAAGEDANWMELALDQARTAQSMDEVPVGAVLVRDGMLLSEAGNMTRTLADPTAHAEMVAIRKASAAAGRERLVDATLYVTLEPCAMCAGAIVLARISRLVFAAADPKTGMCGSLGCLVQDRRLNHRVRLTAGVREQEAGDLLRAFFRARRPGRA